MAITVHNKSHRSEPEAALALDQRSDVAKPIRSTFCSSRHSTSNAANLRAMPAAEDADTIVNALIAQYLGCAPIASCTLICW